MNVKRLDGALLNYWVAKAAGLQLAPVDPRPGENHDPDSGYWHPVTYCPANDWSQAGPILTSDWFGIEDVLIEWFGPQWTHINAIVEQPLKWFMRAYVATQYGDEVEDYVLTQPMQLMDSDLKLQVSSDRSLGAKMSQWLFHINR